MVDIRAICVEWPIFRSAPLTQTQKIGLYGNILLYATTLDLYCIDCDKPSVFKLSQCLGPALKSVEQITVVKDVLFSLVFQCTRSQEKHLAFFSLLFREKEVIKVGQWPSIADLADVESRRYKKVLGEERSREFSRGIGLAAHGVGIGAFVYLRRIFESLIEDAATKANANSDPGWDQDKYQRSRMDEKIEALKRHLPVFLVENRKVYGILSKGIHSLSERECLEAFPAVKVGVELILDEKLSQVEREAKENAAAAALNALQQKLS